MVPLRISLQMIMTFDAKGWAQRRVAQHLDLEHATALGLAESPDQVGGSS